MSVLAKISVLILSCIYFANLVESKANPSQVVSYLEQFGYLKAIDPTKGELRSHDQLVLAVKKLQRMGGIKETGKLDDPDLLKLLETPRCQMPDFGPSDNAKRKRRYALQGSYWRKKDLTYKILNYSPDLTKQQIDQAIKEAFNEWAKVSTLTFTRVTEESAKADINVKFVTGAHDDGYPFDGPGGTLAHAFYPQDNSQEIYGDAHFDDHELFTLKTHSGIDLFWVAVHEFGHSLGLDHSYELDAIMYPYYRGYTPNFKLHWDDVNGIQKLYGRPTAPGKTTTPVPEPATPTPHTQTEAPGIPDKCSSSLDAIVMSSNGYTYAFKGKYFWPIGSDFGAWTSALKIKDYWPSILEDNIDAAFYNRSNKVTYIIKGDKFWMFDDRTALKSQALPITDPILNLNKELASPDAAFQWNRNGKVYFFKGDQYWRYDIQQRKLDLDYPRKIADGWRGAIPDNIDAAIQWENKKSYFFKGTTYTAIDDYTLKAPEVPKGETPYPRSIGRYWMACSEKGKYVGGKILPDTSSVVTLLPNVFILISSLVLTSYF